MSKRIMVGHVPVGGGAPVSIQSMCSTKTHDVEATVEQILRLEEREAYLESQERELREACAAGQAALTTADEILESLGSAEGWGTWDLIGGGLISDLAKHSHLDEAQASVERLQSQMRTFKTELADVTISADFQVNIDGFLRFADYVFDGIFADWAVLDRINQAQAQVESTRAQICAVLDRLRQMTEQAEQDRNKQPAGALRAGRFFAPKGAEETEKEADTWHCINRARTIWRPF